MRAQVHPALDLIGVKFRDETRAMSWVRRVAVEPRWCWNCEDRSIPEGDIYFLAANGERYCERCGPPEDVPCPL